jgi:hypothetical protein
MAVSFTVSQNHYAESRYAECYYDECRGIFNSTYKILLVVHLRHCSFWHSSVVKCSSASNALAVDLFSLYVNNMNNIISMVIFVKR